MNIAFVIVNFPSSGLAITLYLQQKIEVHIDKNQYIALVSRNVENLSYAIQAFVIAAPIPDSEPIKANT